MKLKNKLLFSTAVFVSFVITTQLFFKLCEAQQNPSDENLVDGNKIKFVDLTKYEKINNEMYYFMGSIVEGNEFNGKTLQEVKDLLGLTTWTGAINADIFSKLINGIEFINDVGGMDNQKTLSYSDINSGAIDTKGVYNLVTLELDHENKIRVNVTLYINKVSEFTWLDGSKSIISFNISI